MTGQSYQNELKHDWPTALAAYLGALALLMPTIGVVSMAVPGTHLEARGNPLYWLILTVPASWVWAMTDYKPWALRLVRPMLFAAPFIAGAVLAAGSRWGDGMTQYWVMLAITCVFTAAGGFFYDRSLLAREGPGD